MTDADRAARAFMALALRLWCGDTPDEPLTLATIDQWAYEIPEEERAALNAMLGESFGRLGPGWDHPHPVTDYVRSLDR